MLHVTFMHIHTLVCRQACTHPHQHPHNTHPEAVTFRETEMFMMQWGRSAPVTMCLHFRETETCSWCGGEDQYQVVSFLLEDRTTVWSSHTTHSNNAALASQHATNLVLHLHLQVLAHLPDNKMTNTHPSVKYLPHNKTTNKHMSVKYLPDIKTTNLLDNKTRNTCQLNNNKYLPVEYLPYNCTTNTYQ